MVIICLIRVSPSIGSWFSALLILSLYVCIVIYAFHNASTYVNFTDPQTIYVDGTHLGGTAILMMRD